MHMYSFLAFHNMDVGNVLSLWLLCHLALKMNDFFRFMEIQEVAVTRKIMQLAVQCVCLLYVCRLC